MQLQQTATTYDYDPHYFSVASSSLCSSSSASSVFSSSSSSTLSFCPGLPVVWVVVGSVVVGVVAVSRNCGGSRSRRCGQPKTLSRRKRAKSSSLLIFFLSVSLSLSV